MDQTVYNEIFGEPKWHRYIDAAAVLFISFLLGATVTYSIIFYRESHLPVVPTTTNQSDSSKPVELPAGAKIDRA